MFILTVLHWLRLSRTCELSKHSHEPVCNRQSHSEEAVECGDLDAFLRRNETYKESEFERPAPEVKPIGVPGAYSPSQMHPKYTPTPSPAPSPLKAKTKGRVASKTGDQLSTFGLHDLDVTDEDLAALVQELGLAVKDAKDLVKGLGNDTKSAQGKETVVESEPKDDEKAAVDVTKETEAKTEGEAEQKEEVQKGSDIAPEPAKVEIEVNSDEQPTKADSPE